MDKIYYTYIIRCIDGSLYTGITTDVDRRMSEHLSGKGKCAKYTRLRPPEKIVAVYKSDSRAKASRLEYQIKALEKHKKQQFIDEGDFSVFTGKVDESDYTREDISQYKL